MTNKVDAKKINWEARYHRLYIRHLAMKKILLDCQRHQKLIRTQLEKWSK